MAATLCSAYLRVYQALDTFPPEERERLELALAGHGQPEERLSLPGGLPAMALVPPEERRPFWEKVVAGKRYVCPGNHRLRMLLAMLAFHRTLPDGAEPIFFTAQDIAAAQEEVERLQAKYSSMRPYLLQSLWHVPLRWFVCFEEGERRIEHDGRVNVRYLTTLQQATSRLRKGLRIMRDAGVHVVVVGMVQELNEWLSAFNEDGLLELDYASVTRLFDPDELADDRSTADIAAAIEALSAGDGARAGLYYQRVNERWAAKRVHDALN